MGSFEDIINSATPTLVDFYAEWCGPCKMISPLLEQVSSEIGDTAKILKVDIDKNQSFAASYGIRSVPTLMIFKEGKVVWRQAGVTTKTFNSGIY